MRSQNNIEHELNAIRVELYEQAKDMTPSERVAYYKSLAAPIRKKFGIRTANELKEEAQKTAHI